MNNDAEARLYQAALFYLKFKPRTRREMEVYLKKKIGQYGAKNEDIFSIINELVDEKYIDDDKLAEEYINSRLNRGYGMSRIKLELMKKGIKNLPINDNNHSTNESILLHKVLRRYTLNSDDQKEKVKAINFLLRRGIEYSVAKNIVKQAITVKK